MVTDMFLQRLQKLPESPVLTTFFSAFSALPDYSVAFLNADPKSTSDFPAPGKNKMKICV